jgi:hypothetical protein
MPETIHNGTRRHIDGKLCVYYDGYWIKYYEPPADSLAAKKKLIEALTRRLFNHVEHGINIPGKRLAEARAAYESEQAPHLKRVKAAMLAGALFNRAADIFTRLVELQDLGVAIEPDDSLMRECGRCLMESLELGQNVRHRNGDESIDELWGEPFKAYSMSVEAFYESRYLKIALTMRDIDCITDAMVAAFEDLPMFPGVAERVQEFAQAAKLKCETLRTDPAIFDVWPAFVVAGERLCCLEAEFALAPSKSSLRLANEGRRLIRDGKALLTHITRARVPMPKSTAAFLERCARFRDDWLSASRAA